MPLFKSLFKKKDKKSPGNASIEPSSSNTANTGDAAQQEASTTVASLASKNPASDIPTEAYGLFPLHTEVKGEVIIPQPDPDDEEIDIYPIDIVALHGITGGAFHTWTHDNGTFWLQDFLTVDFPGARVFSYGYDADVFFTLNTGGLDEFSRTLLEHLKQRRTGKAIVTAIIKRVHYQDIQTSCTGIIFLGTPHRGSKEVGFPSVIANIANVATIGTSRFIGKARTDLLDMLKRDSNILEELSINFADEPSNIKIASFIEQNITPPAKTKIVDGVSGIMKCVGERVIDMQGCDHKSICRFPSRTNSYGLIKGIIQEWGKEAGDAYQRAQEGPRHLQEARDTECLRALSFPEMRWRRIALTDVAYENTCTWILRHPSYRAWSYSPQGPLWIKGKPGSGKSTMMESLVQMFESQAKDGRTIVLTFFFNAYGVGQLQKSAMGMYRSLLYQLMEKSSHALAKFRRLYERRKLAEAQGDDGFLFHRNELSKFLTSTLESAVMRTKVTIFIDAIDEAVEGREEVIKFLGRLDKRLRGLRPNTSMCFSCRHHPIITASDKHEVAMEVENLADITTYVNLELEQCALVAREILERTGDLARLKDEIIKRACGLFLWAFLVIPHVERLLNSGMSVNNVLLTLDQAPTRLGEVYADILRNVIHEDDRSIALTLMKWASFTSPPLYLTRLSQEVDFIKVGDIQNKYETLVDNEEQILEIRVGNFSGGLLEVTKEHDLGAAIFIHPTAKRFLKEEGLSLLRRLLRGSSARSSFASTSASSTPSKDTSKVLVDRVDPVISSLQPAFPEATSHSMDPGTHAMRREELYSASDVLRTDEWLNRLKETHRLLSPHQAATRTTSAKIAILYTGVDLRHPEIVAARDRIIDIKSFDSSSEAGRDPDGHGTHAAALLLRVAPDAKIYIARVVGTNFGRESFDVSPIVHAVDYAIEKWDVDIITMYFGFDRNHRDLERAINQAIAKGVIVFAAASNSGQLGKITFPARMSQVIQINSADGNGNPSAFNPPPNSYTDNFSTLGEAVNSAWPLYLEERGTRRQSGTSVATSIAAGIAALILQYSRQHAEMLSPSILQRLASPDGMRAIFRYMSAERGIYANIVPWKLLGTGSTQRTVFQIQSVLEQEFGEN